MSMAQWQRKKSGRVAGYPTQYTVENQDSSIPYAQVPYVIRIHIDEMRRQRSAANIPFFSYMIATVVATNRSPYPATM